jgi:hypothetical protein
MSAIPFAIPLAWTKRSVFDLQEARFWVEIASDCLRYRRYIR